MTKRNVMTREKFDATIRASLGGNYDAMIVVAALYSSIYGEMPKIGLSGAQAQFVAQLLADMPTVVKPKEKKK